MKKENGFQSPGFVDDAPLGGDFHVEKEAVLKNPAEVLRYLRGKGWEIGKSALYNHAKEGKLRPRRDGGFSVEDVDRYARSFLIQIAEKEELERKKLALKVELLELEIRQAEFERDVAAGKYLPKDLCGLEMAQRVGELSAGLDHFIYTHVAEWVRMFQEAKDPASAREAFKRAWKEEIERLIRRFAQKKEWLTELGEKWGATENPQEEE